MAGFDFSPEFKLFEYEKGWYVTKKHRVGIFREQAFPAEKEKNEFRIFILGGSSVYNLDSAPELEWKLEKELENDVRIVNVAGLGYGTGRLLMRLKEIIGYDPDLVILYSGRLIKIVSIGSLVLFLRA